MQIPGFHGFAYHYMRLTWRLVCKPLMLLLKISGHFTLTSPVEASVCIVLCY